MIENVSKIDTATIYDAYRTCNFGVLGNKTVRHLVLEGKNDNKNLKLNKPQVGFFLHLLYAMQKTIIIGMMKLFTSTEMDETYNIWMIIYLLIQNIYIHPK